MFKTDDRKVAWDSGFFCSDADMYSMKGCLDTLQAVDSYEHFHCTTFLI